MNDFCNFFSVVILYIPFKININSTPRSAFPLSDRLSFNLIRGRLREPKYGDEILNDTSQEIESKKWLVSFSTEKTALQRQKNRSVIEHNFHDLVFPFGSFSVTNYFLKITFYSYLFYTSFLNMLHSMIFQSESTFLDQTKKKKSNS